MEPVGRPQEKRDRDVGEEHEEEEERLDALGIHERADERLAEDGQDVEELRGRHGEDLGLHVPDEPVTGGARHPDEREERETRDPADPAGSPESVVEQHLQPVEHRSQDRRVRCVAVKRPHQGADPEGMRHDPLDRAVGGLRPHPIEHEEVHTRHRGDRQREDRDRARVVEGVQGRGNDPVEQHLRPLIDGSGPGQQTAGPALPAERARRKRQEGTPRCRRRRHPFRPGHRRPERRVAAIGPAGHRHPRSARRRVRSASMRASGCASPR